MFHLIVAMGSNRVIAKEGKLPWGYSMKGDLQHFKRITTGHAIVMGRKTYESIRRPLPNRTNIVLTRQSDYAAPGCFIRSAAEIFAMTGSSPVFIIGGAEIFRLFLPRCTKAYITEIHHAFAGDTFFPILSADWKSVQSEFHPRDEQNPYDYTFHLLIRTDDEKTLPNGKFRKKATCLSIENHR
jgi:dihydrofolate reductase